MFFEREDYPFTFFGMYRGAALGGQSHVRVAYLDKGGTSQDFYNCLGSYRFSFKYKLLEAIKGEKRSRTKTIVQKGSLAENSLAREVLMKELQKAKKHSDERGECEISDETVFHVSLLHWQDLKISNYTNPEVDRIVYSGTL